MSILTADYSHWHANCDKLPSVFEPALGLLPKKGIKHKVYLLYLNSLIKNHFQYQLSIQKLDKV